jgi:hypothetical protein
MRSQAMMLLTAVTVAGAAAPTAKQGAAAQCEVALETVRELSSHDYGKPIVFEVLDGKYMDLEAGVLAKGWSTSQAGKMTEILPPSPELAAEFVGTARNAVPRCPAVRAWLTKHRVRYGRAAVKDVVRRAVNDELPAGLFTVSLPSISGDGRTALVYTSDVWGGEAGGGFAHLYRRQPDGSWKSVAVRRLWIS